MRGPSYLGLSRSISWLLMPWLLTSPGHQQPWYWLYRICGSFSYLRKCFKYLCQINVEEWHKMQMKNLAREGLSRWEIILTQTARLLLHDNTKGPQLHFTCNYFIHQGVVSLKFYGLFKIILWKYPMPKSHLWWEFQGEICEGTCTKFQLEIHLSNTISTIHKFWENIFDSSRNVSETTPWSL